MGQVLGAYMNDDRATTSLHFLRPEVNQKMDSHDLAGTAGSVLVWKEG
jgi:hypothetical protein